MYRADTIVACATPAGRGAISIVRCSGPAALAIAATVFRSRKPGALEPWHMRLGTVVGADGTTPLDDVLAVYFPRPFSYSGEDTFEIHCHGSPVVVEQIVASVIAAGARAAERGEFTRRAVLNGKLDLLQAEAIADLIEARMAAGARAAWRQLQGALSDELTAIRQLLVAVLAEIEAAVDFTDDELPDPDVRARCDAIDAAAVRVESLLSGYAASRRQREGLSVVFTGRPNAGKSSLVNRLLGSGRMIVSEEPGTTRDIVEEAVDLGGIAFVLTDTAGIREADGAAEAQAVERARDTARQADLRVYVVDVTLSQQPDDELLWQSMAGPDTIVILNKVDVGDVRPWRAFFVARAAEVLETSARTGAGCGELAAALSTAARRRLEADPVGISRVRHRAALERTIGPLERARRLAKSDDASELVAMELRHSLAELAVIGTAVDNEEILDRIFSEFCIGK